MKRGPILMSSIDYSDGYPVMRAKLPQRVLARYREIMFKLGFYPEAGAVGSFQSPRETSLSDTDLLQAELDARYREKLAGLLGVTPEKLPNLVEDSPGVARIGTGPRPSRWDPQPLGFLGAHFVKRHGWQGALDVEDVKANWAQYVGPEVAAHSQVESFEGGKLTVRTASTAWATQLKWLLPQLEKQLANRLGAGAVKQVIVRGPVVPSWKHGRLSVPGRGPRDTYG